MAKLNDRKPNQPLKKLEKCYNKIKLKNLTFFPRMKKFSLSGGVISGSDDYMGCYSGGAGTLAIRFPKKEKPYRQLSSELDRYHKRLREKDLDYSISIVVDGYGL